MPSSASPPAAPSPAAPDLPAHPASPNSWRLRPATPADVPAPGALYASCARTLCPGCYTPELAAAWASFGADRAGLAEDVRKAASGLLMPWLYLALIRNGWASVDDMPLGFSGVADCGEVETLYAPP